MESTRMSEFDRMIRFLDLAWKRKDQIVPCLVGPVGIGKTAAVRQHAKNVGANKVVTIIASQILPSEVSGITMPDSSTKSMEIYDHYKLSQLEDGDIVFFDELLEADQCVLSACLTLIESRMMMSGKMLPDVQIIAATNPTVNPINIRENIRQRFMFMEFAIDKMAVSDYIYQHAGFRPPAEVICRLQTHSKDFNTLSPRSLTKLCEWIASAGDDNQARLDIGRMIDSMFCSNIGSLLVNEYMDNTFSADVQARTAMKEAFIDNALPSELESVLKPAMGGEFKLSTEKVNQACDKVFKDSTMEELMEILSSLENWPEAAKDLACKKVEKVMLDDNSDVVSY